MRKWISGLIIIIAIILPIYIGWVLNNHLHDTIIEAKQAEAIHLTSHIIHDLKQENHEGHNHTKDNSIHLVHLREDVDLDLNNKLLHENIEWTISDLRVDRIRILDPKGTVIYSPELEHIGTLDTCKVTKKTILTKLPQSTFIHKGGKSPDGNIVANDTIETYIPILFKDSNGEIELVGVFEIYNNISDISYHMDKTLWISSLILIGPLVLIGLMVKLFKVLKLSEEKFEAIADYTYDWETWFGNDGEVLWINHAVEKITGYSVDECMKMINYPFDIILKEDWDKLQGLNCSFLEDCDCDVNDLTFRIKHKDGSTKWMAVSWQKAFVQGKHIGLRTSIRDTTNRIDQELELKESEEKFRLVTQSTHDAIIGIDDFGKIMFWNNGACKVFGHTEEDIIGTNFMTLLPEEYIGGYTNACEAAIKVENSFFVIDEKDIELYGLRRNGEEFPMQVTLTIWPFEKKKIYSAIIKDITERKKFENKLVYQANYDKLTGLPNRNMIDDRLHQAEITARRNNSKASVLFIDLDRFKYVNDTFGHDAGDELLKQVSRRLEGCVREIDTVARLGGDEFLVILNDVKKPVAVRSVAKKIITQLSSKFNLKVTNQDPTIYYDTDQDVMISGSVGIAFYPDDGTSKDELMKKADAAMYQAKEAGKNNYKFYTNELDNENNAKLKIEKELRTALQNDEFYMNYQPIICLEDESIIGAEALLRWNNPTLGEVPPGVFIPIAEEIGLMPKLGDWIFITSCKAMQTLNSDLYISINVSVAQLENPNFPKIANKIIKESGFPPELIQLEITETMMMKNIEKTISIMSSLTKMGVTVAIDDFGTGHSSLSYLKRIKVSTLKIDKSFINDVPNETDDVAIVKAIIKMAQSLNLKLIAEGIEKKEQVKFLKKLNCDRGQGYYYHKPMLISNLEKVIVENKDV